MTFDDKDDRMTKSQWSSGNSPATRTTAQSARAGADPIALGLQQLFAPLAAEPIPDEFMALLEQIDAKASAAEAAGRAKPTDGIVRPQTEASK